MDDMKRVILSVAMASMLILSGCGTMDQASRTVVGSQIGSLAGGILGAVIGNSSDRWDGAELGAQLGSLAGGAAGAVIGANSADTPEQGKRDRNYSDAPQLVVDDIYLENGGETNQYIMAGQSCRLSFILMNNGVRNAVRVRPVVMVEKGKSYLDISDPVIVNNISPRDRVCYTVSVRASRKLPSGKALFSIRLDEGNGFNMPKQNFSIPTRSIGD